MVSWSDIPKNPSSRTLRQFAGVWLVFFLALGAHQYFRRGHHQLGIALAFSAIVIGVLGLVRPAAVRWLFVSWMVLAFPIGWLVSHLMLLVMFYGLMTPVALLFRLRGRDNLRLRRPDKPSTYWLPKETPQDVRSYLRQY